VALLSVSLISSNSSADAPLLRGARSLGLTLGGGGSGTGSGAEGSGSAARAARDGGRREAEGCGLGMVETTAAGGGVGEGSSKESSEALRGKREARGRCRVMCDELASPVRGASLRRSLLLAETEPASPSMPSCKRSTAA
jgi:hypothetical protein